MQHHQDLSCKLAPHLHALSAASTNIFNPLTTVLTTLISELASLRAAHEQLQARVAFFETYKQVPLPHSIPPPPITTPPESPVIDLELTQPPPPIHQLTQTEIDRPSLRQPPVQANHHYQRADPDSLPPLHTRHVTSTSSQKKRLRRKRRSSKRPMSDSATSSGRPENDFAAQVPAATPVKTPRKAQLKSSTSTMVQGVLSVHTPITPHKSDRQPMDVCQAKSEPREEGLLPMKVLPTTPTTNEKPKKRRTDPLTNDPVIEGYKSAAAAVKEAESIAANREAENCPPAFREDAKTCVQCQDLFRAQAADAFDPHEAYQTLLKEGCSHQQKISGPRTPEGYWALDFSETPTQSPPQEL